MAAGSAGRQRGKIPAQLPVKGKLLEQLLTSGHRPESRPEPALKGRTDGQDICSHGEIQEDVLVQKAAEGRKKKTSVKEIFTVTVWANVSQQICYLYTKAAVMASCLHTPITSKSH